MAAGGRHAAAAAPGNGRARRVGGPARVHRRPGFVAVTDPERTAALLSHLLRRAGLDEDEFWALDRALRSQVFLGAYAGNSRAVPELELTAFDVDKLLKERFRREPLTVGAAWHHGYWRSYFSHAAITHPANDGLREEFSTAWDIVRKRPAVLYREGDGRRAEELRAVRLDLPLVVGPLPFGDGVRLERGVPRGDRRRPTAAHDVAVARRGRGRQGGGARRGAAAVRRGPRRAAHAAAPRRARGRREDAGSKPGSALAAARWLRAARIVELDPWGG